MSSLHFRFIRPCPPINQQSATEEPKKSNISEAHISKGGRVSTACKDCQRRRTKCTGGSPCVECKKRRSVCIFDESSDKRRKSYSMRMERQLQFYREVLDGLFEAIRTAPDNDVQRLIEVIRSAQSVIEVQREVAHVLEAKSLPRPAR